MALSVLKFVALLWALPALAEECLDDGSLLQTFLDATDLSPEPGSAVPPVPAAGKKAMKLFLNADLRVVGDVHMGNLSGCPVPCEVTQKDMNLADVVVWNGRWMGPLRNPPPLESKPKHQKWVFNFDAEAPVYGGHRINAGVVEQLDPGIDWTFTFKGSSDFYKPYWVMGAPPERRSGSPTQNWASKKNQLLLWFVSNCNGHRLKVFDSIREHLPPDRVKVYGGCGEPHPCGRSIFQSGDCLRKVSQPYKFYAAFENGRCDGYITEKLWTAYLFGMVPVVWGGLGRADYEKLVPKDSFIHVDDFSSTEELAKYLEELDKDDARYNKYFEWKSRFHVKRGMQFFEEAYCQLCVEASKPLSEQKPSRTFGNLTDWWYNSCIQ